MSVLANLSFDHLLISLMATIAVREILILLLPENAAGPRDVVARFRRQK